MENWFTHQKEPGEQPTQQTPPPQAGMWCRLLWMISQVSSRSPPRRAGGAFAILHPGRAIRRPKRAHGINDRGGPFDPGSAAKWRQLPPIVPRAAAVRRHAVCSAAARADITSKIS